MIGDSSVYLYVYREAESWDRSYDETNGMNFNITPHATASDGYYTHRYNYGDSGDYAEWDFTVYKAGTYYFYIRAWKDYDECSNVSLYWNDTFLGLSLIHI